MDGLPYIDDPAVAAAILRSLGLAAEPAQPAAARAPPPLTETIEPDADPEPDPEPDPDPFPYDPA